MPLTQKYLNWNDALIPQVKQCLLSEIKANEHLVDLSHLLVIIPTAKSGRHLLEALSTDPLTINKGFLSPKIVTPIQFLELELDEEKKATDSQCILTWIEVLGSAKKHSMSAVFPNTHPFNDHSKLTNARRFHKLRKEMGSEGHDFASVADTCIKQEIEVARWKQLAALEQNYYTLLRQKNLLDPIELNKQTAEAYQLHSSISKIILVATPDPKPLPLKALQSLESKTTIEVWINGPETEGLFDLWGIPIQKAWKQRSLDFSQWHHEIIRINNALEIPERLKENVENAPVESIQIGLLDPNLISPVSNYFSLKSIPYHNPEGISLNQSAIGKLIISLIRIQEAENIDEFKQLLLNPYFFQYTQSNLSIESLINDIDKLFSKHLTYSLKELKKQAEFSQNENLVEVLDCLETFIYHSAKKNHESANFAEWLSKSLNTLIEGHGLIESDGHYKNISDCINNTLEEAIASEALFLNQNLSSRKAILLDTLEKQKLYKEREKNAHDLFGWLELLWHDAPHSLICGFNESVVPRSNATDSFLTENLRKKLGMKTNEDLFANDLYLFEAICQRRHRKDRGKVTLFVPEMDGEFNPVMPSRILFQISEDYIVQTTKSILLSKAEKQVSQNHQPAWILNKAQPCPLPKSFSVTQLKDYLRCPFRFYLKHILKIKIKNFDDREMSASTFGTLFHKVVAQLKGETLSGTMDESKFIQDLQAKADSAIHRDFGYNLSFALQIQKENLHDRLSAFAQSQVQSLLPNQTVEIIDTEKSFSQNIDEFIITGTIDRIDLINGQKRIIDYKTSSTPKKPKEEHLHSANTKKEPNHLPEEAYYDLKDKNYYWSDLQLPLYCSSEMADENADLPELYYYNIPKSSEKTELARWDDFSLAELKAAKVSASAILNCIKQGKFWPPNEQIDPRMDEFAELFPDGIKKAVDGSIFENYKFNQE
ncbi:MAG: PD-(D/E)XK nuclease family protein [Coraliomargaritaceae bacterium]